MIGAPGQCRILLAAVVVCIALPLSASETERLYLSGTGFGDTVDWEFFCSGGRRSGEWTTIPVPSQWELQGFGHYNYGHDDDQSDEQGRYRLRFRVPEAWEARHVELVFEGVMTDAEVWLNGATAGPRHQGGFTRFRYDVGRLLRHGELNSLEVLVSKRSADASVNRAEREADYWIFGGIYRPVCLEASPVEGIERLAVDARHDGTFTLDVFLRHHDGALGDQPSELRARIEPLEGESLHEPLAASVDAGEKRARVAAKLDRILAWSAEIPHLYRLEVELVRGGRVLHRVVERFGFRTVEARPGEGLFVNDRRVLLKGINRHAFWPPSGRTLNAALDRRDAGLIKAMNMNAVRASHYPPDTSFLDACDELGLYVIDELAGWHDAYATTVGRRLVREMVVRDVNHPSVIFWANGNEDGWNRDLDAVFHDYDPQRRVVLHPRDTFGGFDTTHYPTWSELVGLLDPKSLKNRLRGLFGELPLVMPTEMLHGLYDGGSGAGLDDFWWPLEDAQRAAGAFLWSFSDEAVVRTDRGGQLDSDGNHAPDGILGPYRERTGNYYAVRELFSPVRILPHRGIFDGSLRIENRFHRTDLSRCRIHWAAINLPRPGETWTPGVLASGEMQGPTLPPGEHRDLKLSLPLPPEADAVKLQVRDPYGRAVVERTLPLRDLRADFESFAQPAAAATETGATETGARQTGSRQTGASETPERYILTAATTTAEFDRRTGELVALVNGGHRLPVTGLRTTEGAARATSVGRFSEGDAEGVEASYAGGLRSTRWSLHPSGWLRLEFEYAAAGSRDFHGVYLESPRETLQSFRWLGEGPARVWWNRLRGGTLGVWTRDAAAPELEGFYAGIIWAELETTGGRLTLAFESKDLYFGLFAPAFPADAEDAVAATTPDGIGFYKAIPAIGTKFHPAADLGPGSQPYTATGPHRGVVWLYAGTPPQPLTPRPPLPTSLHTHLGEGEKGREGKSGIE